MIPNALRHYALGNRLDHGRHQHSLCQSRSCRFYGTGRYFHERRSQDDSRGQPGHWGIENNNHVVATGGSTQHLKHKGKPTVHCEIRHTAHELPKSMRISSSGVSMLHLSQVSRIQFILNPKRSESTHRIETQTLFSGYTGLQHTCSEAPNGHVGLHPKP